MKKKFFLSLFSLSLLADLTGIALENGMLQIIFKPLIVLALIFYFIINTTRGKGKLVFWILFALFFSLAGDILLMFDSDPDFFLAGLSTFLLAHLFYIIFFYQVGRREGIRPRGMLFVTVAVYYASLIYLLYSRLNDMKLPVVLYGLVISTMFLLALHMYFIRNKVAGEMMLAGAALFVISDSLLAINKFYSAFSLAGILIMLTYAGAQLYLVLGASRYINVKEK